MAREAWEEKSFQVFTDMDGVLRSGYYPTGEGTVNGNIAVDFVWGNVPLQPNDDRSDDSTWIGGGEGDNGWQSTWVYTSDTLAIGDIPKEFNNVGGLSFVPTNNVVAQQGWSNFPGFIPDYEGDGDSGLETVVPNFIRKTIAEALVIANESNVSLNTTPHYLTINAIEARGTDSKTIRVYAWDTDVNNWGDTHGDAYLIGLKKGDQVEISVSGENFGPFDFTPYKTVTAVNNAGESSWFEFKNGEAVVGLDESATGTVYAGPNLVNVLTTQRSNTSEGEIVDEGRNVNTRYFGQS